MSEKRTVIMGGAPVEVEGNSLKVGDKAPDFNVIDLDSNPKSLRDFPGKVRIISSVPSLDTAVCDRETRHFNQLAAGLGEDVLILTISVDLPPAQKRWCGAAGIDKVVVMSDHREVSFGTNYRVLMPSKRQLARCVFVLDKNDVIRHVQLVPAIGQEPDYDEVLAAVKALI